MTTLNRNLYKQLMKVIRIILMGLAIVPAVLLLGSFGIGVLNVIGGASTYGSQRAVGSLLFCVPLLVVAFLLWPGKTRKLTNLKAELDALPEGQSRADFIASIAASKLDVSRKEFDLLLTRDLNHPPRAVMNLWNDLGDDFGIDLSEDDFPAINSIEALRSRLSKKPNQAEHAAGGNGGHPG